MFTKKAITISKWAAIPVFLACNWYLLLTFGYQVDRSQYLSCDTAADRTSKACSFEFRLAPEYNPSPDNFSRKDWTSAVVGINGWGFMLGLSTPILMSGWLLVLSSRIRGRKHNNPSSP